MGRDEQCEEQRNRVEILDRGIKQADEQIFQQKNLDSILKPLNEKLKNKKQTQYIHHQRDFPEFPSKYFQQYITKHSKNDSLRDTECQRHDDDC